MIESKENLKAFFVTNKAPTQENFWKLIDAFVHHDEQVVIDPEKLIQELSEETILALANRIESSRKPVIQYHITNTDQTDFELLIQSQDGTKQLLTGIDTNVYAKEGEHVSRKLHLLNQPPYQLKLKRLSTDHLSANEYYLLTIDFGNQEGVYTRLVGHDLPDDTMKLIGTFNLKNGAALQLKKMQFGKKVNTKKINVQFLNNTATTINYALVSDHKSHLFQKVDGEFETYDLDGTVYFNYKADMTNETKKIECKIFNADTQVLLATAFLNPAETNRVTWGGGAIDMVNDTAFRIECEYQ